MEKIGLFPLNIVVFPESSVPLHIFEPRYKQLINVALEQHKDFGINLVDSARLYQTGCTVEVIEVSRRYPDGRLDIIVRGKSRYTLRSLREGEELYYVGIVDYFDDEENEVLDMKLRSDCIALYNELVEIVYPGAADDYLLDAANSGTASFIIAQKAGLDILRKQELLEIRSENRRLEILYDYIQRLLPDLREKRRIQDVIMSDGYIPNRTKH
ncbi:MAG: LON peptidase substrate-binding domain-containing protein [Bacteroidota bacterium]|nr:LON peptidase substrate-binding domain-containing protein [Candidatus Kapabacteria bacterium]MDW8220845.1 LON peptidase substrate-binding domain-containing protein [Bacteroidota bacterium]